jgi:hypothetical protein
VNGRSLQLRSKEHPYCCLIITDYILAKNGPVNHASIGWGKLGLGMARPLRRFRVKEC